MNVNFPKENNKNWKKFSFVFVVALLIRLLPFRAPNLEPILTIQMPFSKIFGGFIAFSFAFFSIAVYDFLTAGVGVWTLVAGLSYGMIGLWSSVYFRNKGNDSKEYLKFAIMSTLAFDAVTGLTLGPVFFEQPLSVAFFGQIPFTLIHLAGNSAFAYFLSPIIYNFIINSKSREVEASLGALNPQKV